MNKLEIKSIVNKKIKIHIIDKLDGVCVKFKGEIEKKNSSTFLEPLFEKIHLGSVKCNFSEVILDFKELRYMNSNGIKAVAQWIMRLSELDDSQKYQIRIFYNKKISWQNTSLHTLTFLVPGSVFIE